MKNLLVGFVVGAHVVVLGGAVLIQGCGTTRGPVSLSDSAPMPPAVAEEERVQVHSLTPAYKPASIEAAVSALPTPVSPPAAPAATPAIKPASVTEAAPRNYVVAKGDSLSTIARKHGVSVPEIMILNHIGNANHIRAGQTLKLPAEGKPRAAVTAKTAAPKAAPKPDNAGSGNDRYVVKAGDSLSAIAHRHGTTIKALKEANQLTSDRINIGQKLVIPPATKPAGAAPAETPTAPAAAPAPESAKPRTPSPAQAAVTSPVTAVSSTLPELPPLSVAGTEPLPPSPARSTYTVKVGDDLLSVAAHHNVSIAALMRVNQITSGTLVPGQTLIIPSPTE